MGIVLNSLRFLVVDDNDHMRRLVRRILHQMGVETIHQARDGAEAITEMQGWIPDILLTNWMMAPMDGIELTRYIRRSPDSPNKYMPIIMLTGFAERSRVFQARDAGVTEFLVKPISAQGLFSRICAVVENPRNFVRVGEYFGPDRRRHKNEFRGRDRRGSKEAPRPAVQAPAPAPMSQKEINDVFNPR